MSVSNCICCGSTAIMDLVSFDRIPILCNELYETVEDALKAPTDRMDLCFCQECGHYFNRSYDAGKMYYSPNYETSLYSSSIFRNYADTLADRLIVRYDVNRKKILEIGCGRGEFLRLMCTKGENSGIGFDTSASYEGKDPKNQNVHFIIDYFSKKYEDTQSDFIICQQVLDHILDPKQFLQDLAGTQTFSADNCIFYCEVPNGLYSIEDLGIWDLIYEHVSYFSSRSLQRLFESTGFEILEIGTAFGNQYLYVESKLSKSSAISTRASSLPSVSASEKLLALNFADRFRIKTKDYAKLLESKNFKTEQTFIWGAGSKGITFSNLIDSNGTLAGLIDKNPAKQGKYIGGTGNKIFRPEQLRDADFSAAFVMNPQYMKEIEEDLNKLGIYAKLYSV
jgi:SAM-dependent methyltransferase